MRSRSRLLGWALGLSIVVPLTAPGGVPAAASTDTVATTTLGDLGRAQLSNGAPALITATATQEFHGSPDKDQFLGAAVLQDEALGDTWAHGGELGAWLTPEHESPEMTFRPELNLNESLLFQNTYDGGPALAAGDRAGFSLGVVPYNAPVPWDRERGAATGTLQWSAATATEQTTSTFGGTTGGLETMMFRADVVAVGGDVDAREAPMQLPPLVVDLPRSYDNGTRYVGVTGVTTPYTTYFSDFNMVALPEAGKMILRAEIEGYIPEGKTVTLPNGSTINEWSLPLTGVISFATEGEGEPTASLELPGGGIGKTLSAARTVQLGAGDALVATTAGSETAADDAPAARSASPLLDDARETSRLDRASRDPLALQMNNGFSVTVHPDYQGTGVLALEGVRSDRLRRRYADLVTVPAVRIAGQDVALTRDKLVGLRAVPFRNGGGIRVSPSVRFVDGGFNQSITTSTRIYRGGFLLDARYLLDGGIVVNVEHQLFHQGVPDGGRLNTSVQAFALDGRPIEAYPVASALLSGGSVSAAGAPVTTETTLPSTRTLEVDDQRIDAVFRAGFGTMRAGTTTVLKQPAPLMGRAPDQSVDVQDVPLVLAIAPPATAIPARVTLSTLRFGLDAPPKPQPTPPELGEACHGVQIQDEIVPDAPPSHDIQAAWFEADRTNVYVSMQVTDVPAAGPAVPVRYATYLWSDHEQYVVEALQQSGKWIFQGGFGSGGFRIPLQGDVVPGANGIVRITLPKHTFDLADGDLLRDLATHSFAAGPRPIDSAPTGSGLRFGLGDDYRVAPCAAAPDVLATALELDPIQPVQYSDAVTVTGNLHDESGAPVPSRQIALTIEDENGAVVERAAETADDGTFSLSAPASMAPGDYRVTAAFAGEDGAFSASTATTDLAILKEDSALTSTIEGKGASRAIVASLYDLDDSTGIGGRELAFYADGTLLGSGSTGPDGRVTFRLPPRYREGHHDYETLFAGDTYFVGSVARTPT